MLNILEFRGVCKYFPGVKAIDDISFKVKPSQVHALIGENGAGKSTLMKVLGGIYQSTKGSVYIKGKAQIFKNPHDAISNGIAIIHQELQLIENLSVAENIFLGRFHTKNKIVNWKLMNTEAKDILNYLKQDINPTVKVSSLSIGQKQMIEIAKALALNANILAFDEPTSSLSEMETKTLFNVVNELRKKGKIILYISHRIAEIFSVCDSCTILKDGRKVETIEDVKSIHSEELISKMTGKTIGDIFSFESNKKNIPILKAHNILGTGIKKPSSFYATKGEILGFFGLVGSGRSELLRIIYGASHKKNGEIILDDEKLQKHSIGNSIKKGLMFLSENRKEDGIITTRSIIENINISCRRNFLFLNFIVNFKEEFIIADNQKKALKIKTPDLYEKIENLSGGNQQKVLLARWLSESNVKVLIVDEPTRGIDVSSKNEIYKIFYNLAKLGVCIIVISSELPEVIGITDRMYIMREGEISTELTRDEYDETKILKHAFPQN